nr:hypothetical protein [uncultured Lichenicoccus sp.]
MRSDDALTIIYLVASPERHEAADKLVMASYDMSFPACYGSVLDQCWLADLDTLHPTLVKECPKRTVPFDIGRF